MVTFSIIADVGNTSKNLVQTLKAISQQTFTDYELLIIGTASSSAIEAARKANPTIGKRLRVIERCNHRNLIPDRNKAISEAKGIYIAFIEEKAIWRNDYLAQMAKAFQNYNDAAFAYSYSKFFMRPNLAKEASVESQQPNLVSAVLVDNYIHSLSSMVCRRSLFETIGLFDEDLNQLSEREFYLRALEISKPVIIPHYSVEIDDSARTNKIDSQKDNSISLTYQQQKQFNRATFQQKIMQKSLLRQSPDDIRVELKLKPKFALNADDANHTWKSATSKPVLKLEFPSTAKAKANSLVSLIVTVYNRESYIRKTIESILAQTYSNFELIIWDDGSTDRSLQVIHEFARQDKRIRVFSDLNRGRGIALNKAIALSNSEYLGLVDSDDWLHSEALTKTVEILNADSDVGMVYTDHFVVNENGNAEKLGKRCSIPYSSERLLIDFMTFHFRLIRRSIYDAVGGFNRDFCPAEDYDLCLRLSEVTKVKHLVEPLYYYRRHKNSLSNTQQLTQTKHSVAAINNALNRRGLNRKLKLDIQLNPSYRFKRQTKVANKVFGIGLSKTGTTSLNEALCLLGIPSVHLPRLIEQVKVFDGATDISIAVAYQQLDLLYPGSKFILTVRDPQSWLRSNQTHRDRIFQTYNGKVAQWMRELIVQCFGQWKFEPTAYLSAYKRHSNSVREYFKGRESDLLILDVCGGQGWNELCAFLGCSVPDVDFPHHNQA